MIKVKEMPKNIFDASKLIIEQEFEKERLQNKIRELEVRLFLEDVRPFCGNKEFDKEGNTQFCNNCKSMMFENETGGYETRKAHRIK